MNVYKQGNKLDNSCIEKMLEQGCSVSQIQKTACKFKNCTNKDKKSLLDGKITPKELRDKAFVSSDVSQLSFEDIYAEIKDVSAIKELHLSDTAGLFEFAVSSLEDVIQTLLSDRYIVTFEEDNKELKDNITDCCNRLDKIIKVITSLLA